MSLVSRLCWSVPAVAFSLCWLAAAGWAQSITPAQDGTQTRITQEGNRYDIDGGTLSGDRQTLFHSFERLGLNADEVANFLANPQLENILGRVTGGDTSVIDGLIRVTGGNANLYLMNPAGILLGPNARLDLAGAFTATTATGIGFGNGWFHAVGDNDYDALVGSPSSFAFSFEQPGAIANLGNLTVAEGQSLALLGGTVVNTGTLTAPGGTITVAAVPGENLVRLSQAGSLLSLEFEPLTGNAPHALSLTPATLPQLLTGGNLDNATALTVDADGTVRLGSSATAIAPDPGSVTLAGTLTTAAPQTAVGSEVVVVGDRLFLRGATIDASGDGGGGTIRIGGDYQGQSTLPAARQTWVDADTTLAANGEIQGHGGRIILWSEEDTRFGGSLTAQGGSVSGNGGFVEVSGRNGLGFAGSVDVSAPQGDMGTLLLDPASVVIGANGANNAELDDGEILATDPGGTFFITADRVVQLLNTGNVAIAASTNIDITSEMDASGNTLVSDLTLTAPDILLDEDMTLNGGDVTFNGNLTVGNGVFRPGVRSPGGTVTFNGTVNQIAGSNGLFVGSDTIVFADTVGGVNPVNVQLIGRNASFNSTAITRLDGISSFIDLTDSLQLTGQNFLIEDTEISVRGSLNAQVQSLVLNTAAITGGNLNLQAVAMNVNNSTVRSRQDLILHSQTNLGINSTGAEFDLLVAGRNLQITAASGSLLIQDAATDSLLVEAGNGITLQGGTGITLNALNDTASLFRSPNDITLISDGTITADARFGAGGNFAVLDTLGNPQTFTTATQATTGIISASGNVTFGDYNGVALWVEALGSIQAGNITITGANPTATGTAPEVALISGSSAVILRAGVPQLTAPATLGAPTVIEGTNFIPSAASGGNLTTGNIQGGRVILSASGSIMTGNVSGFDGIDMAAPGNITTGNLNSSISDNTLDYGRIQLISGGDITVSAIDAGAGGVDVTAAGSFRALGYNTALLETFVPLRGNTELIDYLISQGVPANLFDDPNLVAEFISIRPGSQNGTFDPTRTDNIQFPITIQARPDSEVITSSGFTAPIVIRYGGAGSTLVDNQFSVEGRPGRITIQGSGESFVIGPATIPVEPALVPEDLADTFAAFDPNNPFNLRLNNRYGLQSASAVNNGSGTVGAIAVGEGFNANLYGSLQNNTFAPLPPDPGGGDPGGGGPGGGGPGGGPGGGGPVGGPGGGPIGGPGGGPIGGPGGGSGGPVAENPGSNPPGSLPGGDGSLDGGALQATVDQSQSDTNLSDQEACEVTPGATEPTAIALRSRTTAPPCLPQNGEEPVLEVESDALPAPAIAPSDAP